VLALSFESSSASSSLTNIKYSFSDSSQGLYNQFIVTFSHGFVAQHAPNTDTLLSNIESNNMVDAIKYNFADKLRAAGHAVEDVDMPSLKYALAIYYIVVPAEVSSNLARYDGVRYGNRAKALNLKELYANTRGEGFGDEAAQFAHFFDFGGGFGNYGHKMSFKFGGWGVSVLKKPPADKPANSIGTVGAGFEAFIITGAEVDRTQLAARFTKELEKEKQAVSRLAAKLSNINFTDHAPAEVVEGEKDKLHEAERRIEKLTLYLHDLI